LGKFSTIEKNLKFTRKFTKFKIFSTDTIFSNSVLNDKATSPFSPIGGGIAVSGKASVGRTFCDDSFPP